MITKFELVGVTVEMTPRPGEAPLWTTRELWGMGKHSRRTLISHTQVQKGVSAIIAGTTPRNMGWIVEHMNAHTLATLAGPDVIKDTWRSPHSGFNALAEWQSSVRWLEMNVANDQLTLVVDNYLNRIPKDTLAQLYKALGSSGTNVIPDVEQPPSIQCKDCGGTGKYQGLWTPEEVCSTCSGTGVTPQ